MLLAHLFVQFGQHVAVFARVGAVGRDFQCPAYKSVGEGFALCAQTGGLRPVAVDGVVDGGFPGGPQRGAPEEALVGLHVGQALLQDRRAAVGVGADNESVHVGRHCGIPFNQFPCDRLSGASHAACSPYDKPNSASLARFSSVHWRSWPGSAKISPACVAFSAGDSLRATMSSASDWLVRRVHICDTLLSSVCRVWTS